MRLKFVVLTMCSTLATGQALAAEDATDRTRPVTVRVQDTPVGPQIHVDGKPVPPRFFLGWDVFNRRIAVDESWGEHAFEFTPDIDVPGNGTLHLRFDKAPGDIWFSDLRVTDVATGADVLPPGSLATEDAFRRRWTSFPPATGPTTAATLGLADGALHVAPVAPEAGAPWPDFHLYSHVNLSFEKGRTYRCVFRAKATRGQAVHPAVYLCADSTWTRIDAGDGPFLSQVALARNAGVDLISFGASITWTPPGQEPNWTPLDTICRRIIDVNPNALLLPRLSAEAPRWWLERYPEARMVYDQEVDDAKACVSNRTYRADVSIVRKITV